jgi:hypothetical protein
MRSDALPRQAGTESIEPIALMLLTAAQAPVLLAAKFRVCTASGSSAPSLRHPGGCAT